LSGDGRCVVEKRVMVKDEGRRKQKKIKKEIKLMTYDQVSNGVNTNLSKKMTTFNLFK